MRQQPLFASYNQAETGNVGSGTTAPALDRDVVRLPPVALALAACFDACLGPCVDGSGLPRVLVMRDVNVPPGSRVTPTAAQKCGSPLGFEIALIDVSIKSGVYGNF